MVLETKDVRQKLREIEAACHQAMLGRHPGVPTLPGRDVEIITSRGFPPRPGLSLNEGRARLLHDMASIELQAMELALRSLIEFPEAPEAFRHELVALTLSEGEHLKLCLDGMEELGFQWGDWPAHLGLWEAVSVGEGLLDRILIVHRYLEGSGLDAGDKLKRRLDGMPLRDCCWRAIDQIHREEIGHVEFGSRWYRDVCRAEKIDPDQDFKTRMTLLRKRLPFRTEQLAREPRLKAGFTLEELDFLEKWRERPE